MRELRLLNLQNLEQERCHVHNSSKQTSKVKTGLTPLSAIFEYADVFHQVKCKRLLI